MAANHSVRVFQKETNQPYVTMLVVILLVGFVSVALVKDCLNLRIREEFIVKTYLVK